ncbi:MAG: AmmeMemoRadiSam system protein B [Propionibacteriaceae bacterium]|jgi:AmmeMemoRadiSam system protein B|nr:AmmeMemoRadiSam system protein B [Propionibacteriaceae bacterium]
MIRPAAVAGLFYPGDAHTLEKTVDGFLDVPAATSPTPRALVAPHAGYVYSGSTAGQAYACWKGADLGPVVVLGPCHRVGIPALALPDADALATPLGEVSVWERGVELVSDFEQVVQDARVHAEEHSIEVHLPFLQRLGVTEVLPLAVGWVSPADVAEVLDVLFTEPELRFVVSSDLSHYLTYPEAQAQDAQTIERILALESVGHEDACGYYPLNGFLLAARDHGWQPKLLAACNSGDTAGDKRRVVGYASFAFYE